MTTPEADASTWKGIGLTAGLHLCAIAFVGIAAHVFSWKSELFASWQWFGLFLGVTQLVYMLPAMLIAGFMNKDALLKGLMIGAGVTFLLNATCAGLAMLG